MGEKRNKRWSVSVPFAGYVIVEVDAASKEAAIKAAMESEELDINNAVDVAYLRHIVDGNVCHAPLHEAEADEIG